MTNRGTALFGSRMESPEGVPDAQDNPLDGALPDAQSNAIAISRYVTALSSLGVVTGILMILDAIEGLDDINEFGENTFSSIILLLISLVFLFLARDREFFEAYPTATVSFYIITSGIVLQWRLGDSTDDESWLVYVSTAYAVGLFAGIAVLCICYFFPSSECLGLGRKELMSSVYPKLSFVEFNGSLFLSVASALSAYITYCGDGQVTGAWAPARAGFAFFLSVTCILIDIQISFAPVSLPASFLEWLVHWKYVIRCGVCLAWAILMIHERPGLAVTDLLVSCLWITLENLVRDIRNDPAQVAAGETEDIHDVEGRELAHVGHYLYVVIRVLCPDIARWVERNGRQKQSIVEREKMHHKVSQLVPMLLFGLGLILSPYILMVSFDVMVIAVRVLIFVIDSAVSAYTNFVFAALPEYIDEHVSRLSDDTVFEVAAYMALGFGIVKAL